MIEQRVVTEPSINPAAKKPIMLDDGEKLRLLVDSIIGNVAQAESDRSTYIKRLENDRAMYASHPTRANKPYDEACELAIPMLVYTQQSLSARVRRALFTSDPTFNLEGRSEMDKLAAPYMEQMLHRQFTQIMSAWRDISRAIDAGFTDGVGVTYHRWKTDNKLVTKWAMIQRPVPDPFTGQPMIDPSTGQPVLTQPQLEPTQEDAAIYDAPTCDVIPIEYCGVFPANAPSIQDAYGVYVNLQQSGNDLLASLESGDYDSDAVHTLMQWPGDERLKHGDMVNLQVSEGTNLADTTFNARPFKLLEVYWPVPVEKGKPANDWLLTIHQETKTVLRAIPNPWWHGKRPLVTWAPYPNKYGIIGRSLPDLIGDMQQAATTFLRLFLDALADMQRPPMVVKTGMFSQAELDVFKRKAGPGTVWEVNNPDAIRYLEKNIPHPSSGLPLLDAIRQYASRGTGTDDLSLGKSAPKQATATEIENMIAQGELLFADICMNLGESLADAGRFLLAMNYQMAGHTGVQKLWKEIYPQDDSGMLLIMALSGDYDLVASGSAESANATLRKSVARELYGAMLKNPLVAQFLPRVHAVTQYLLNELGVRYPERFIGTEQAADRQQMALQQQQMAMIGGENNGNTRN